jgi:tRNA (guanine-N7-)-methyltransferase
MTQDAEVRPPIRSFGRVRSRTLRRGPADRLRGALPQISLCLPQTGHLDLSGLCGTPREIWVEIGFGAGEHLVGQALRRPDVLFLAAEPFQNGVAALLGALESAAVDNVRVYMGDGRDLLAALPPLSVDRMFVLFPDPWPKTRHWKRRLLSAKTLAVIAQTLKPGGGLRVATDWAAYAESVLGIAQKEPLLSWTARRAADWSAPDDHVETRYQRKGLGDVRPLFLDFQRA